MTGRAAFTDMINLVRTLKREAEARGVPVLFRTPVTGLVAEEGRGVTGVMVRERSGRTARVRARKGVVLASGGFARDPQRLRAIEARFDDVVATSGVGHGRRLAHGRGLGADTRDIEYVQPSFELHADGATSDDILILYSRAESTSTRSASASSTSPCFLQDIAKVCLDQPGKMGFQIFDRTVYEKAVAAQARGQGSPMTLDARQDPPDC